MSDGTIVDAGFQANEVAAPGLCEPKTPRLTADERDKLRALRERQREAQREVDDCKSELKSAKVSLEACTDAISRYIDSLDQPQLPFGEKPAQSQLTDVAGIGQAKAEQIEQALEAFWAARKIEDLADQVPALEGDNA